MRVPKWIVTIIVALFTINLYGFELFPGEPKIFKTIVYGFNPNNCYDELQADVFDYVDRLSYFVDFEYAGEVVERNARDNIWTIFCGDRPLDETTAPSGETFIEIQAINGTSFCWMIGTAMFECDFWISPDASRTTVAHELTHGLGIAHDLTPLSSSLMAAPRMRIDTLWSIDDLNGLCYLYGCNDVLVDFDGNVLLPSVILFNDLICLEGELRNARGGYTARNVNEIDCGV